MSTPGAFLSPIFVPARNGFISLPQGYIHSFLSTPDMATILVLSWETIEGYVQRVCVGWVGGVIADNHGRSDVVEISTEFARCIGLQEHVANYPQTIVGVHLTEAVPVASRVDVDPCTSDDWELIQLHAGALENEFLRQVCVVNARQIVPIWVHQNVVVRVRVTLPMGMEHARLTSNSEVVVAPKDRRSSQKADLDPEFYYKASNELSVQTLGGTSSLSADDIPSDEVWVHPTTFALLDGSTTHEPPVVSVWKIRGAQEDEETTQTQKTCCIAYVKCSEDIGPYHIALPPRLQLCWKAQAHDRLRIRVLRLNPLPLTRISLKHTPSSAVDKHTTDDLLHAFYQWLESSDNDRLLFPGMAIDLALPDTQESFVVDVEYDLSHSVDRDQIQDSPVGALEEYAQVNTSTMSPDIISFQEASESEQRLLHTLEDDREKILMDSRVLSIARSSAAYKELSKHLKLILDRTAAASRVLLGTDAPSYPLVYGGRGNGKTTLLDAMSVELSSSYQSLSFCSVLDCRALRGLKMETVKAKLKELMDAAESNAPSCIMFDNLDALVPVEDESAGPANDQSRRIAEFLIVLLQQNRDRMAKTSRELRYRYDQEVRTIVSRVENKREAVRRLVTALGSAMLSKTVQVAASARSDSSIHSSLNGCGLLERCIELKAPNAERREEVIQKLLELKLDALRYSSKAAPSEIDASMDYAALASVTEGYSLRDLSSICDRTLHRMTTRCLQSDSPERLLQSDFTQAQEGFQPTALVGVDLFKSSVKWEDVGGLTNVRSVLKDTLELPTRYARLYDEVPIKLPSGLLLYGPPGCGKTMLASAVAHECGLNFISVKGPEVLNKYIGASEQAIRDLFGRAASAAPSILFLDEFDSIAPRRGADNTGVTDRLVNQLLTFLDGVEGRKGVYVLAATSRPDMIDPALLRPGRLDKSLYCGFPTAEERLDILRAVSNNMELTDDAQAYLTDIANAPKSQHFSGADIQAVVYSAQLELVHENLNAGSSSSGNLIEKRHLEKAFLDAKPSTSVSARIEFERMYSEFSGDRDTDFTVATSDATATADTLKSHESHQRTALA